MTNAEKLSNNDENKVYEVGYLLLPNIEEVKISGKVSEIKDIVEKNKGSFISEGAPEIKNLTYTMVKSVSGKNQKYTNAYFGWLKFEANAENVAGIKKGLDGNDSLLRYLLIVTTRENVIIPPVKTGKFSFNEGKPEVLKEEVVATEETVEAKKELDSTID